MNTVIIIVWIVVFIICWSVFHKFFVVFHFSGWGVLSEIIGVALAATIIVGCIFNPILEDKNDSNNTENVSMDDYYEDLGETLNNYSIETDDAGNIDYNDVIPESSIRYIEETELSGLSKAELRIARNEIYARHGRIFESEDLKNYFGSKSWYTPLVTADNFDENSLNEYEKANVSLIVRCEQSN